MQNATSGVGRGHAELVVLKAVAGDGGVTNTNYPANPRDEWRMALS